MDTSLSIYVNAEHKKITDTLRQKGYDQCAKVLDGVFEKPLSILTARNNTVFTDLFNQLPSSEVPFSVQIGDSIVIGDERSLDAESKNMLDTALLSLKPWRKGPFTVCGTHVDTEWQSFIKWNRLAPFLPDLSGKVILDVGCSSGYYMFRMLEGKPDFVLGIDPTFLFYLQFQVLNRFAKQTELGFSPIGVEALQGVEKAFDMIFCMGILYHQRYPIELLKQLKRQLRPNGTLVLETLVMNPPAEDGYPWVLSPQKTYAMMPNVHFIPTLTALYSWLDTAGFKSHTLAFLEPTTTVEQRKTPWIDTYSLEQFLHPDDPSKTCEGYPGPLRAGIVLTLT